MSLIYCEDCAPVVVEIATNSWRTMGLRTNALTSNGSCSNRMTQTESLSRCWLHSSQPLRETTDAQKPHLLVAALTVQARSEVLVIPPQQPRYTNILGSELYMWRHPDDAPSAGSRQDGCRSERGAGAASLSIRKCRLAQVHRESLQPARRLCFLRDFGKPQPGTLSVCSR